MCDMSINKIVMGIRDASGWRVLAQAPKNMKAGTYYSLLLAVVTLAELWVDIPDQWHTEAMLAKIAAAIAVVIAFAAVAVVFVDSSSCKNGECVGVVL